MWGVSKGVDDMTTDKVKAILNSGGSVCNIGQMTKPAAAWLRRQHKAGKLVCEMDYGFPSPKPRYWIAA